MVTNNLMRQLQRIGRAAGLSGRPVSRIRLAFALGAAFVAVHYQPEPRRKVKRNDPFKDGAFVRDRGRRG